MEEYEQELYEEPDYEVWERNQLDRDRDAGEYDFDDEPDECSWNPMTGQYEIAPPANHKFEGLTHKEIFDLLIEEARLAKMQEEWAKIKKENK